MQNDINNTKLQATTKNDIFFEMYGKVSYDALKLDYDAKYYKQIQGSETIGYLVISQDKTRYNLIKLNGEVEYCEN